MILLVQLGMAVLALWVILAVLAKLRHGLSFHQAFLYVLLKLPLCIRAGSIGVARAAEPPVIYAIWQNTQTVPALMLSLLPDDTLHILDDASARSPWLEPWRAAARTIAFNAHHVFVSRRLVRRLKGNGRLAVYLPDEPDPDTRAFRLFRAVARIALKADANVVPIYVTGGGWLSSRTIHALEPKTVQTLINESGVADMRASTALFERMMKARV